MMTEHALRRQVVDASQVIWERGWVANHDGNVSARAAPGRIVATPTSTSKRLVAQDNLLVIDESARVVQGRGRVFSEIGLHLLVYGQRTDVRAVVHAHPPYGAARSLAGQALPCFLAEAVVSLGLEIPCVPFAMPGAPSEAALAPFIEAHDAVLLGRHGALTWGVDVEQALLRMELVEHLARIAHIARTEGTAIPRFEGSDLEALLAARTRAGLGPAARKR